jgi:hypothetical protein
VTVGFARSEIDVLVSQVSDIHDRTSPMSGMIVPATLATAMRGWRTSTALWRREARLPALSAVMNSVGITGVRTFRSEAVYFILKLSAPTSSGAPDRICRAAAVFLESP